MNRTQIRRAVKQRGTLAAAAAHIGGRSAGVLSSALCGDQRHRLSLDKALRLSGYCNLPAREVVRVMCSPSTLALYDAAAKSAAVTA